PFSGQKWGNGYEVEGQPAPRGRPWLAQIRPVSPDYFRTLGIALRRGEAFSEYDRQDTQPAAVVNEAVVRRHWPGEDPIGKHIGFDGRVLVVRGVIADIKHGSLAETSDPEIYVPYAQLSPGLITFLGRGMTVLVRSSLEPHAVANSVREVVRAVDKDIAVRDVQTMNQLIAATISQPRFRASLLGAFSVFATLLAALGVYGLMSYVVAERRQELGVRLALGASPRALVRFVVSRALLLTVMGAAAGVVVALFTTRAIEKLLYGIQVYHPVTFLTAPALLVALAVLAAAIPARRAASVDPAISLRSE
ncbi:MAG TPA: FtsX-like permease family protein, partial [Bryobacteraceae bacterium]|nr:FtsX-like permease family protein [Bryobacteraceae bacterium]